MDVKWSDLFAADDSLMGFRQVGVVGRESFLFPLPSLSVCLQALVLFFPAPSSVALLAQGAFLAQSIAPK